MKNVKLVIAGAVLGCLVSAGVEASGAGGRGTPEEVRMTLQDFMSPHPVLAESGSASSESTSVDSVPRMTLKEFMSLDASVESKPQGRDPSVSSELTRDKKIAAETLRFVEIKRQGRLDRARHADSLSADADNKLQKVMSLKKFMRLWQKERAEDMKERMGMIEAKEVVDPRRAKMRAKRTMIREKRAAIAQQKKVAEALAVPGLTIRNGADGSPTGIGFDPGFYQGAKKK